MKSKNLTGKEFGRWKVLTLEGHDKRKNLLWLCECSCEKHTRKTLTSNQLLSGNSLSCGCLRKEKNIIDLTGQKFGRLNVLEFFDTNNQGAIWKCKCDCGKIVYKTSPYLKNSVHPSCGCWGKELKSQSLSKRNTSHGDSSSRLYKEWRTIKYRCSNKSNDSYKYYGEKGIKVCDNWVNNYENFKNWALNNGYQDDLTIDRIDNNKGYCPENCRWVTQKMQANNRTNNIYAYYKGNLLPLIKIVEITGKPYNTIYSFYRRRNELYGKKYLPLPENVNL